MQVEKFWLTGSALLILITAPICGRDHLCSPALAKKASATYDAAEENFRAGLVEVRKRNYEGAVDLFLQATYFARNSYHPEAWKYLGLCYKATRNYAKAIEALNRHLQQVTKKSPDAHIDLAECYMNIGEFDKARDEIGVAFTDAENGMTYRQRYAMGLLEEKMGRPDGAIGHYEYAISDKKNFTDAWMGKARCEVLTQDYKSALKDYNEILTKGPLLQHVDYHEVYYNMGTCFKAHGDHQGAADHFHMALKENPDSYDANLALANLFDEEQHISSAVKRYQAAIRCAPKGTNTTKAAQRMQYLQSLLKKEEPAPVIKPTPSMRREFEERTRPQQPEPGDFNAGPVEKPKGDAGF